MMGDDQLGHFLDYLTCYKSFIGPMRPNTCSIDYFDVMVLRLAGMTFLRQQLPQEIRVQMSWAYHLLLLIQAL